MKKNNSPFYQNGLYFSCEPGCAACCKISGKVHLAAKEIVRIADYLNLSEQEFTTRYIREADQQILLQERDDGSCIMLDDNDRCLIHPVRPMQCQTYPFWDEILTNHFTWILEHAMCPGINKGRYYSFAEIESIRREQGEAGGYNAE